MKIAAAGYNVNGGLGCGYRGSISERFIESIFPEDVDGVWVSQMMLAHRPDGSVWTVGGGGPAEALGPYAPPHTVPYPTKLHHIVQMDATAHGIALDSFGQVWTWGANNSGAIGNGTENPEDTGEEHGENMPAPYRVELDPTKTVASVACGGQLSAAIFTDGTIATWGENMFGQVGNGKRYKRPAREDQLIPCYPTLPAGKKVVEISIGGSFAQSTHVLARCSDGTMLAWGAGGQGQLGVEEPLAKKTSERGKNVPTKVVVATNVVAAFAAYQKSLCIKEEEGKRNLWGWGRNAFCTLRETGENEIVEKPVKIAEDVRTIAAAGGAVIVVKENGKAYVLGINKEGRFGAGFVKDEVVTKLTEIKGFTGVKGAVLGQNLMAALLYEGEGDGTKPVASLGEVTQTSVAVNWKFGPPAPIWKWLLRKALQGAGVEGEFEFPVEEISNTLAISPATATLDEAIGRLNIPNVFAEEEFLKEVMGEVEEANEKGEEALVKDSVAGHKLEVRVNKSTGVWTNLEEHVKEGERINGVSVHFLKNGEPVKIRVTIPAYENKAGEKLPEWKQEKETESKKEGWNWYGMKGKEGRLTSLEDIEHAIIEIECLGKAFEAAEIYVSVETGWPLEGESIAPSSESYTFKGLEPGTAYTFQIASAAGAKEWPSVGIVTETLPNEVGLAATVASAARASATLTKKVLLSATVTSITSASATLTKRVLLGAAVLSRAIASATLTKKILLDATVQHSTTVDPSMTRKVNLSARVATGSVVTAKAQNVTRVFLSAVVKTKSKLERGGNALPKLHVS